jgi:hypothetical protein
MISNLKHEDILDHTATTLYSSVLAPPAIADSKKN